MVYGALFLVGSGAWGYVGHYFEWVRWVNLGKVLFWEGGSE